MLACAVSACDKADDAHPGAHNTGAATVAAAHMQNGAGHTLAVEFCSDCHATPRPAAHTADEWPGVMARMLDNMRRGGRRLPDTVQIETILDYLQANARP